jgi:hypothetical protein
MSVRAVRHEGCSPSTHQALSSLHCPVEVLSERREKHPGRILPSAEDSSYEKLRNSHELFYPRVLEPDQHPLGRGRTRPGPSSLFPAVVRRSAFGTCRCRGTDLRPSTCVAARGVGMVRLWSISNSPVVRGMAPVRPGCRGWPAAASWPRRRSGSVRSSTGSALTYHEKLRSFRERFSRNGDEGSWQGQPGAGGRAPATGSGAAPGGRGNSHAASWRAPRRTPAGWGNPGGSAVAGLWGM